MALTVSCNLAGSLKFKSINRHETDVSSYYAKLVFNTKPHFSYNSTHKEINGMKITIVLNQHILLFIFKIGLIKNYFSNLNSETNSSIIH